MDNVPIQGGRLVGAPRDWKAELQGECLSIHVLTTYPVDKPSPDRDPAEWPTHTTAWRWTAEEREAMDAGGAAFFSVRAPFVPVMQAWIQHPSGEGVGDVGSFVQREAATRAAILSIAIEMDRRAPDSLGRSRIEPMETVNLLEFIMGHVQLQPYRTYSIPPSAVVSMEDSKGVMVPVRTLDDIVRDANRRKPATKGEEAPADLTAGIAAQLRAAFPDVQFTMSAETDAEIMKVLNSGAREDVSIGYTPDDPAAAPIELTKDEWFLLEWLAKEDKGGQLGECKGPALDSLVAKGLATIADPKAGHGWDYAWATVTEAGHEALRIRREAKQ